MATRLAQQTGAWHNADGGDITLDTTGADFVVVLVTRHTGTSSATTATCAGAAMTPAGETPAGDSAAMRLLYIVAPTQGASTVIAVRGSDANWRGAAVAIAYSTVDQTTPLDAFPAGAFNDNSATPATGTFAAGASDYVLQFFGARNSSTTAPTVSGRGTGQANIGFINSAAVGGVIACVDEGTPGDTDGDWTLTGAVGWGSAGIALNTASGGGSTFDEDRDEALSAADSASSVATLPATASETLTATASESSTATLIAAEAETLAATDAQDSAATLPAAQSETLAPADSQSSSATLPAALAEAVTATDAQTAAVTIPVAIAETLSAADSSDAEVLSGVFFETVSESVSVTDSASALLDAVAAQSDVLAASDAPSSTAELVAAIAELLSTTDSSATSVEGIAAVLETLNAADTQGESEVPALDAIRWARIDEGPAITLLVREGPAFRLEATEGPAIRLTVQAYTEDGSMAWHPDNTNHIEVEPRSEADQGAKVTGATVTALIEKAGVPVTGMTNPMVLVEGTGRRVGVYFGAASKAAAIVAGDTLTADIIVDDGVDRYAAGTLTIAVTARVLTAV